MKDINTFIDDMVDITPMDAGDCFGHYPFKLLSEDSDGKLSIGALALGGDVKACYDVFKKCLVDGAKRVYMSVDFPGGGDIEHDFVAVFQYENGEVIVLAIPYNTKTGETFDRISESVLLSRIKKEFKWVLAE